VQPTLAELENALMRRGPEFWDAGSHDGGLYFDVDSWATSELYLAFSESAGFLVQHIHCGTDEEYAVVSNATADETVVIRPGGNPWRLPKKFFVDRATAWKAVRQFSADGSRAADLRWAPFDFPELEP